MCIRDRSISNHRLIKCTMWNHTRTSMHPINIIWIQRDYDDERNHSSHWRRNDKGNMIQVECSKCYFKKQQAGRKISWYCNSKSDLWWAKTWSEPRWTRIHQKTHEQLSKDIFSKETKKNRTRTGSTILLVPYLHLVFLIDK